MNSIEVHYIIIYSSPEILLLQNRKFIAASHLLLDFTQDYTELLSKLEARRPTAIFILQTAPFKFSIATKLRQMKSIDDIPIYVCNTIQDIHKLISVLPKSKTVITD